MAFFASKGRQTETSGTHAEREANLASNFFSIPCQPRVSLQGKIYILLSHNLIVANF